jgi:metallo-beta-lactamase family protein
VLAEIANLKGMSGHADASEMLRWMSGIERPPRRVFLTHGEEEAAQALGARIARERGFPTHVPAQDESATL